MAAVGGLEGDGESTVEGAPYVVILEVRMCEEREVDGCDQLRDGTSRTRGRMLIFVSVIDGRWMF